MTAPAVTPGAPGRPGHRIGLDIGGTKIEAVALDDSGAVLARSRRPSGFGRDEVLASALAAVVGLAGELDAETAGLDGVGVGVPGVVDAARGRIRHSVNLGIDELALGPELSALLGGVPVAVDNDVDVAALGAAHVLGLGGSIAYLNLGTGLAAGFVDGGVLRRGAGGVIGEIGHIPVDPRGEPCGCGQRGCLETVASGSGLRRQWAGVASADAGAPAVRDGADLGADPAALFAAAEAGEPRALVVRDRFLAGVAAAVRLVGLASGVDTIVIGGGLSNLGEPLLDGVTSVLRDWGTESAFLASVDLAARLRLLPPGNPAAAIGAALGSTRGS